MVSVEAFLHSTGDRALLDSLNDEFISLLLAGKGHVSLAESFAQHTGCSVIIESASHQVVAYAGGGKEVETLVSEWDLQVRGSGRAPGSVLYGSAGSRVRSSRQAVLLKQEIWGWVHALCRDEELERASGPALIRLAEVIGIALMREKEGSLGSSERQDSLINRLLIGDITGAQFVGGALRIGRDLRDRQLAVLICRSEDLGTVQLDTLLEELRLPVVQADLGGHTVGIIGLAEQTSVADLVECADAANLRAGIGRLCTAERLPLAVRQARTAAAVASSMEQPAVVLFDSLGLSRLFAALDEGPELRLFIEDEIGELLAYDETASNPLIPTLRAYLACGGNKTKTAEALFVQRGTLYHRLDRIKSLLARSIEDPEARTVLDIALRGWDFLHSQAARRTASER